MTTPDVNVLVAAFRASHVHHRQARAWLTSALESCATGGNVELLPMVAAGFLDVSDAWIAAAVTANGLHLVTFDRDFTRLLRPAQYTLLPKTLGIAESRPRYGVRKKARRRRKVARAA